MPINDAALNNDASSTAFYCVHDVTGAAGTDFVDLAQRLGTTARFYGFQVPPKKMQDADFGSSIESIATYYKDVLTKFQPEGPFLLGGFCAGAIVALEIAQQLRTGGRDVRLLVAIDAVPENTRPELSAWHPIYLMTLARNLPGWIIHGGLKKHKDTHSLLRRFSHTLIMLSKAAIGRNPRKKMSGGYAIFMDLTRFPPAQRLFINRFYNACFDYAAENYLGNVVVYEASVKPLFHWPQLGSRWRTIAQNSEIVRITGTHLSMMQEPDVGELARDMLKWISKHSSAGAR